MNYDSDDLVKKTVKFLFLQVVSVITEGLPQVFGTNLVGGQVFLTISQFFLETISMSAY